MTNFQLLKIKSNFSLEDNKTITLLLSLCSRGLKSAPDGSRLLSPSNRRKHKNIHLDKPKVAFSKNDFIWSENEKSKFVSILRKNIEFIDDDEEKSLINQARHWSEDLERDDIRKKSKKEMSQVAKFIEKGLQQTISTKIQTKSITEKQFRLFFLFYFNANVKNMLDY